MNKGQTSTLLGTLMMFVMVMIFSFFIFLAFYTNSNFINKNTEDTIKYEIGNQRKRAVIDTTLADEVWRAPKTPKGYFENVTGYDLISYYYATPNSSSNDEDYIYIHNESIHESDIRSNLTHYLGYKMNESWLEWRGDDIDYFLKIETPPRKIQVSVNRYHPSAEWSGMTVPIAIDEGETVELALWTKTSKQIYGIYR